MSPRPPIICSTGSVYSKPLDEAFALFAQTGFDGVELMVTTDPDTRDPDRIRASSEDHGLPILAVHAPFLLMTRRVWGTEPIDKIERAIDLALEVGAGIVVVHPPYRWQARYRRWLTDRLPAVVAERGIVVAVENMFPLRVRGRRVAHFHAHRSLDDLAGFANIALDTSHLAVSGSDPVEALETLGDRLGHVHLSNNAGRGWDSHLPPDEGVLDLGAFLEALAAHGFGGAVSLEIDLRSHVEDDRALRRVLTRSRQLCESRLSLPA